MSIRFNQITDFPIVSEMGNFLGKVKDLVIDPETGRFLALILETQEIFGQRKLIQAQDVNKFSQEAMMVKQEDCLKEIHDLPKVKDILKRKIKIKNNRVLTQSGIDLGRVDDFEIDLVSLKLSKIFVVSGLIALLSSPKIIPVHQIVSIGKEAVIVKDSVLKEKNRQPKLATAPEIY